MSSIIPRSVVQYLTNFERSSSHPRLSNMILISILIPAISDKKPESRLSASRLRTQELLLEIEAATFPIRPPTRSSVCNCAKNSFMQKQLTPSINQSIISVNSSYFLGGLGLTPPPLEFQFPQKNTQNTHKKLKKCIKFTPRYVVPLQNTESRIHTHQSLISPSMPFTCILNEKLKSLITCFEIIVSII